MDVIPNTAQNQESVTKLFVGGALKIFWRLRSCSLKKQDVAILKKLKFWFDRNCENQGH